MKNVMLVVLALSLLSGCKSLDSVRSQTPVATGTTNKNVNSFSSCVSGRWAGNGTQVTSLPLENGISILVPQALGGYDIVLDVKEKQDGSEFVLYERIPAMTSDFYENSVIGCK